MLYKRLQTRVIGWWRDSVGALLRPIFNIFQKLNLTPNHITLISLLFGFFGVICFAIKNNILFSTFIIAHILFDVLDGNYARYLGNKWLLSGGRYGRYFDFFVDSGLVVLLLVVTYFIRIDLVQRELSK